MATSRFMGAAAALLMTACATTPEAPVSLVGALDRQKLRQGEAVQNIQGFSIHDWRYLTPQHLSVGTGPGQYWLLTLAAPCHGLRSAEHLGFTTTAGGLSTLDSVVIPEANGPDRRCPISELHRLESSAGESRRKGA